MLISKINCAQSYHQIPTHQLHPQVFLSHHLNIVENNVDKLDANKEQIIFCQTGITSKKAISILQKNHFKDSFSLKNGALEVMNHFKKNNYEKP